MNQARPTVTLKVDLSGIERRLLAAMAKGDKLVDVALQLPRRHPLRFGMLYGMGPRKLYDYVEQLKRPSVTERTIGLEAELRCFENWQENTGEAVRERVADENSAIARAAMEEATKALPDTLPLPLPTEANVGTEWPPYDGAVTGRRWAAAPEFQFPARQWLLQARNSVDDLKDHPYPEHGILRD